MRFYGRYTVPRLLALVMRNRELVPYWQRIVAVATGHVLEIGIGRALNPRAGAYRAQVAVTETGQRASLSSQRLQQPSQQSCYKERQHDVTVCADQICTAARSPRATNSAVRLHMREPFLHP